MKDSNVWNNKRRNVQRPIADWRRSTDRLTSVDDLQWHAPAACGNNVASFMSHGTAARPACYPACRGVLCFDLCTDVQSTSLAGTNFQQCTVLIVAI